MRAGERVVWVGIGALISTAAQLITRLLLNHPIAFKEKQ